MIKLMKLISAIGMCINIMGCSVYGVQDNTGMIVNKPHKTQEVSVKVDNNVPVQQLTATDLENEIVGYWIENQGGNPIEFTSDGKYITYSVSGPQTGTYQVISGNEITINNTNGDEQTAGITIDSNHMTIQYAARVYYQRATPLDLSVNELTGVWGFYMSPNVPCYEFFNDSTYAMKEYDPEIMVNYTIKDKNQFVSWSSDFPEKRTKWGYLSKTDSEYHLYWSKTEFDNGTSKTKLYHLVRPISNASAPTPKTPDELVKMAFDYYERHYGQRPPKAMYFDNDDGTITIKLYEDVDFHTATWAMYTVNEYGIGIEERTFEEIDLNS